MGRSWSGDVALSVICRLSPVLASRNRLDTRKARIQSIFWSISITGSISSTKLCSRFYCVSSSLSPLGEPFIQFPLILTSRLPTSPVPRGKEASTFMAERYSDRHSLHSPIRVALLLRRRRTCPTWHQRNYRSSAESGINVDCSHRCHKPARLVKIPRLLV